jgi:hypothetical protein
MYRKEIVLAHNVINELLCNSLRVIFFYKRRHLKYMETELNEPNILMNTWIRIGGIE